MPSPKVKHDWLTLFRAANSEELGSAIASKDELGADLRQCLVDALITNGGVADLLERTMKLCWERSMDEENQIEANAWRRTGNSIEGAVRSAKANCK